MRRFALALPLLLVACAHHNSVRPLRPQELAVSPYDGIISARAEGSLAFEDGCLLFREDGTNARLFPIWPVGTIFNGTSVIFHEPAKAEQPVLLAQQFLMQGRTVDWSRLDPRTYAPFEHQCGGQPFLVSGVTPAN